MREQHNIETAEYAEGLLDITGWIFACDNKNRNMIEWVRLVFASKEGETLSCDLPLEERQDVAVGYGLGDCKVGFSFRGEIGNVKSVRVYIEYSLSDGNERTIDVLKIQSNMADADDKLLRIEYPPVDDFYNIRNFIGIESTEVCHYNYDNRKVDIIIPVYNGYQYFERLFDSIFKTNVQIRVIIINDASPDLRVDEYIQRLKKLHDNIIYICSDRNDGFVKSVNKGLAIAENDVALVNTDVEVPPYWLERLMTPIFEDGRVASATPYTTCGTICSFPVIGEDNPIYDNRTVFFVDAVMQRIKPVYCEMPTGVGFCMGMSIKAIKIVGLLDEENFEKGYGEENDWCQRAISQGFKNVQVENLFVYHKHGGSFVSKEKQRLLDQNTKKLVKKHPKYMRDVAKFFEYDKNKRIREYAFCICLMQTDQPTYIFFNHCLGGGASDYLDKRINEFRENHKCIVFSYDIYKNIYKAEIIYKKYDLKLCSKDRHELLCLLQMSRIDRLYINELVSYPDLFDFLEDIKQVHSFSGGDLILLVHDFYCICPTINLVDDKTEYCGIDCVNKSCQLYANHNIWESKYSDISRWRKAWGEIISECAEVRVFSEDSKAQMQKAYGVLDNIKVKPHITDGMMPVKKLKKQSKMWNIGVIGVLSERKGLNIIKEMLSIIDAKELPVNIIIVGSSEEIIDNSHCVITGKYSREELPRLMYLYDIDIVFIASVWPETFSYTTEEAIKMEMPLALFDIGAPAERARKYDKSLIIPEINPQMALDEIMEFAEKNSADVISKQVNILYVVEYSSFSSRYRVEHCREYLAMNGIHTEVMDLDKAAKLDIREYSLVYFYRCSELKYVEKIVKAAHKHNIAVYYDLDDFIYDFEAIRDLPFMKDKEYENFEDYSGKIRKCMSLCDVLTTSTYNLAEQMRKSFQSKKVVICRNVASLEMQQLSETAYAQRKNGQSKPVVLGYFSGSNTHNGDWKMIERVMDEILDENAEVELLVVGCLEMGDLLSKYGNRVQRKPFMDWQELPGVYAEIDINLMPLEDNVFQWCKSENKWMEAGLLGIPTVASRNPELEYALTDRENVLLCQTQEEWKSNLQCLIDDSKLRTQIGKAAKKSVYETHLVTSKDNFKALLNNINKSAERYM